MFKNELTTVKFTYIVIVGNSTSLTLDFFALSKCNIFTLSPDINLLT